jgi:hypothetical protein
LDKEVISSVNALNHFLSIRIEGKSVGSGRISVSHLLQLMSQFNKTLHRCGMVLMGQAESLRKGPTQKSIKDEIALDLIEITHGSPATLLGFERSSDQQSLEGMDFGLEIIEKSLSGLQQIQQSGDDLPVGFDPGVLIAWRDMGTLFEKGVNEISFSLNHRPQPIESRYDSKGFQRIQERIRGPQVNIRTIEGRLLMADFKEHGTRCRIHPSIGDPVLCLFDEDRKEEVLDNILHYVKVIGEAKEDPFTGKISSIVLHDIQRLEDREQEGADLLPQGTPLPASFWQSLSIEELAQMQGVKPIDDITTLFGTWPGEPDDGFEEDIHTLRQQSLARNIK